MVKKKYYRNEGWGLARDGIKVCQMSLFITTSKVDAAFHPSEVNKMSTRDFWELRSKK